MSEFKHLTEAEAIEFFAKFYGGEHHIPGCKPKQYGLGFCVEHDRGDLATFDGDHLTRLVLMAHYQCIRVSVEGLRKHCVRISIWKRQARLGSFDTRHPDIETAIDDFNKWMPKDFFKFEKTE